jgi:hypothetical protein
MSAASPSPFFRRLRALGRRLSQSAARLTGRGRIEGFVDGYAAGEIRGWAMDPGAPGRRVHVVAVSEGRVVAEALADLSRTDLMQDGRGDGRHAFRLRLPPALLDGSARKLRVEAVGAGPRARLLRGDVEIRPPEVSAPRRAPPSVVEAPAPAMPRLVVWGEADDEARARTRESARAQDGPAFELLEIGAGDPARLAESLAASDTVVFARAGDLLDPALGRMLTRTRPLHDVITWDGADAWSRRPEARALGVLLGESLDGAFAVRGHALAGGSRPLLDAVLGQDLPQVERLLAARSELRWAHLPARLSERRGAPSVQSMKASAALAPPGYRWRAGVLSPEAAPARWSVGIWPGWSETAQRSLWALLTLAPADVEIELLAEARVIPGIEDFLGQLRPELRRAGLVVRPVDLGAASGAGAWTQALGQAATGEFVLACQAGVVLEGSAEALQDLAAWAGSSLAGTVTAEIRPVSGPVLAGLAARRTGAGWAARSAYDPAMAGRRRPVLGAPAAFLAVGRDKLAAVGGFGGERLGEAADLGLALRLRRAGAASVLIGDLTAAWTGPGRPAGDSEGAALAAFDAGELAAAACAFPPPEPEA